MELMSKKNTNTTTKVATPSGVERPALPVEASDALAELKPELDKYPEAKIRRITLDVPRAVSIAGAAQPRVLTLRDRFIVETPKIPIVYVDRLKVYAMGAWFAHLAALPKPASSLDALKLEAAELKADLIAGAEPLAYKGLVSKEALAKIKEGSGFLDLANDNVALSALYTEAWPRVENKTAVEWAQVERAAVVGPQLILALGEKIGFSGTTSEATRLRARAISLFLDVYDELRRAVEYMRWHEGDAASFVPTLYQGGGRRPTAESPSGEDETPVAPAGEAAPAGGASDGTPQPPPGG